MCSALAMGMDDQTHGAGEGAAEPGGDFGAIQPGWSSYLLVASGGSTVLWGALDLSL